MLDADLMHDNGLAADDLVRIATERGRSVLARLDAPAPGDARTGIVRMDRFLRQALKAHLNETVEIEPAEARARKRVELIPADRRLDGARSRAASEESAGREPHAGQRRRGALHPVPRIRRPARPTKCIRLAGRRRHRDRGDRGLAPLPRRRICPTAPSTSPSRTSAGSARQIKLVRELVQLPLQVSACLSPARHQSAARHHPLRAAGRGQDASRARGRQRGRGALLLHQRPRHHRHLYRRDRGQSAPHLRRGRAPCAVDHLHRRARRDGAQARRDRRAFRHPRGHAAALADGRAEARRLR